MEAGTKKLDRRTAHLRAENWCAYQERAHSEVRNKLYEWGVYPADIDQIISSLISDNFLNEERFAFAYVSGKFNIKKWGKQKIRQGLKNKRIHEKLIHRALNSIDGDDYIAVLRNAANKKLATMVDKDPFKRKYKLVNYLIGRGFERDLIMDVLNANNLE